MGLYMLYAVAILYLVAKDTFPLKNQIVIRKNLNIKRLKTMKDIKSNVKKINPLILFFVLTLFYFIFIIVIQYADFKGKEDLKDFVLMPNTPELRKKIDPIEACLFSILLVFNWYFVMCLARLSIRKAAKWESNGAGSSNSLF